MSGTKAITEISDVLFGKTRGALLKLFYGHPDESYYFQQIRRVSGTSGVGTVQRELETLVNVGLITKHHKGNQVYYRANQAHPIYPEMRALVAKTVGLLRVLSSAFEPIRDRIRIAFVYGSLARQQEHADSDVDLMIVGDATLPEVLEHLSSAETEIARPINPTVYSVAEFVEKLDARNHFLTSVLGREKVFLIGDEIELRTLRKEQLDS
ncbi:MAG: nucleotidyltransferase [Terriglobia bacterium]|nr:nucleotidyltransferase [Terriglobia bacterium]